jgi:hypothetical protein
MVLIAGAAIGIWIAIVEFRSFRWEGMAHNWCEESPLDSTASVAGFFLCGVSLMGPPLVLSLARRRPWGAGGRILWFAYGIAAYVLCPPAVYYHYQNSGVLISDVLDWTAPSRADGGSVLLWCVPLMSLFVPASLIFGGWLRRSRRRRMWRSWQGVFGMLLTLAWALLGLYILVKAWRNDVMIPF